MAKQNINPITRLDYPDPDIIRVDDTYYMISTTMYFMPGCSLEFKLDHFTGARFGLFVYSTKEAGGCASFSNFIY